MNRKAFVVLAFLLLVVASPLYAEDGTGAAGLIALGAGLAIGLAALEGIARNPNAADRIFTPMILGLALIESLVIYGLVIAFMLQAKIPG